MSKLCMLSFVLSLIVLLKTAAAISYGAALTKSLLYYEAQRSGNLPRNQRVQWRGDSALNDGKDAGMDLVGGYYDAGDNVKFGLPMAFTITMLSWSTWQYRTQMLARGELSNALGAIKWGTDYLMKAHPQPYVLYGQVGDGASDHSCWQRPEEMTTPRDAYKIDEQHPGADLAGETAAALAAAAVAFKRVDPKYSSLLLMHARQLFDFATKYPGVYQNSIPSAGQFYSSSGYQDEQLWAAVWLALYTGESTYLNYINRATNSGGTRTTFSWDDKYIGIQVLITKGVLEKKLRGITNLGQFRNDAEQFICNCIQRGNNNVKRTNGGLLWFQLPFNNLQYVTSASFIITAYADTLAAAGNTISCPGGVVGPLDLIDFARSQVDYILGSNPKRLSYMVGFGQNYPKRVHHRGASIVSIKRNSTFVDCGDGFNQWFYKNEDDPNVLQGAIVGGPDLSDEYTDSRQNYMETEPATANTAPLVGVLARLTA